jgi:hypothetical protein
VPAAYRAGDPAGGFGPIVGFSDYAVSSWNGSADPETCGLPNATIDDQVLGIHLDGIIYLEGTASWSNGLTGYEVPVFVGGGSFYVPETESFVTESVVSVSFKGYP